MTSGHPNLIAEIRRQIDASGGISFARFMELALYHPRDGYYASGRARIGRRGDFFTNVSVGPIFGRLLAAQFAEIWELLGRPVDFTIVEQGGHDGAFAADVLRALCEGECGRSLHYVIVEPLPVWRKRQQEKLASFSVIPSGVDGSRQIAKISWVDSLAQLKPFTGVHFSNELFDSLPVHLVCVQGTEWREKLVTRAGDHFALQIADSPNPAERLPSAENLPPNYETEINLAAPELTREIAAKLSRGVLLTIDYGFPRAEFYAPERTNGTLHVRAQHRKVTSPFEQIGLADISAHVEWTSVIEAAEQAGGQLLGFADQHHFLTGIISGLFDANKVENLSAAERRALQTLLHPEMLGRNFQALALGKNFGGKLSGFRFAPEMG